MSLYLNDSNTHTHTHILYTPSYIINAFTLYTTRKKLSAYKIKYSYWCTCSSCVINKCNILWTMRDIFHAFSSLLCIIYMSYKRTQQQHHSRNTFPKCFHAATRYTRLIITLAFNACFDVATAAPPHQISSALPKLSKWAKYYSHLYLYLHIYMMKFSVMCVYVCVFMSRRQRFFHIALSTSLHNTSPACEIFAITFFFVTSSS